LLIRTQLAAICGSDLHLLATGTRGEPGSPGHESVGVVLQSNDPAVAVGTSVLCVPLAAGATAFAELQVQPASAVLPLPWDEPQRFLLAQQLGTAIFAMKRFWPQVRLPASARPATAAVVGAGPAGLAFVQLLHRAGFRQIVVSDLSPRRLRLARAYGATDTVLVPERDIVAAVADLTDGVGVDLAIEAAGSSATRAQVMRVVRDEGRIGLFGLAESTGLEQYPFDEVFHRRATIEMTWNAQAEPGLSSFREAIDLVASAAADTPPMISDAVPLEQIGAAFALAGDPARGAGKVAVTFG